MAISNRWVGATALAAAMALLVGASDFAACQSMNISEINQSQSDDFASLGAGATQMDSFASLGAGATQVDSVASLGAGATQVDSIASLGARATEAGSAYSQRAATSMGAQTNMQSASPEVVFRSMRASRKSKMQSKKHASSTTASKHPSKGLKKQHVFAVVGFAVAVAAALGAGFVLKRRRTDDFQSSNPLDVSPFSSTPDVSPISSTPDVSPISSTPGSSRRKYTPSSEEPESDVTEISESQDCCHEVTVMDKKGEAKKVVRMPFEGDFTSVIEYTEGTIRDQDQTRRIVQSLGLNSRDEGVVNGWMKYWDGFTIFKQMFLGELLGIDDMYNLLDSILSNTRDKKHDLGANIRVFPVMGEIKKVYKANPKDKVGIAKILVVYFSNGKYTAETAKKCPGYLEVLNRVSKRLDKVPSWIKQYPSSEEEWADLIGR
eukprot:GHVT01090626.1.p1 GENE.GHVT01090626.1~~GHVT01090626.1.p1  ORF type:complete len:434 (-),score=42.42 GHVT01090626.1:780-2081(-)